MKNEKSHFAIKQKKHTATIEKKSIFIHEQYYCCHLYVENLFINIFIILLEILDVKASILFY